MCVIWVVVVESGAQGGGCNGETEEVEMGTCKASWVVVESGKPGGERNGEPEVEEKDTCKASLVVEEEICSGKPEEEEMGSGKVP